MFLNRKKAAPSNEARLQASTNGFHRSNTTTPQTMNNENEIDEVVKSARDSIQTSLEVELALFMSAAGISNGASNFYFRQFLSRFRPDFKLPAVGVTMSGFLQNVYSKIVNRMTMILTNVNKFALMLNVITLEAFEDCHYLCTSVAFENKGQVEIFLLDVCNIPARTLNQPNDLILFSKKALNKYFLAEKQIVRTLISGLEPQQLDYTLPLLIKPLNCTYHKQLPLLLNEALNHRKVDLVKNAVMLMTRSFEMSENGLCSKFEQETGIKINTEEMSYDKLVAILLEHRTVFLKICQMSEKQIYTLDSDYWNILHDVHRLKKLITEHYNAFKNDSVITVDQVVPFLNQILHMLKEDFKSLQEITGLLETKINQTFSYILDSNIPNFESIYVEAAYLNPRNARNGVLTEPQKMIAELGEKQDRMTALLNNYKMITSDPAQVENINPFEFWHSKTQVFGTLAHHAIELLSCPIEATLPFEQDTDATDDLDDCSTNNHYTYIKLAQNVNDLERNAIIRINKKLYDPKTDEVPVNIGSFAKFTDAAELGHNSENPGYSGTGTNVDQQMRHQQNRRPSVELHYQNDPINEQHPNHHHENIGHQQQFQLSPDRRYEQNRSRSRSRSQSRSRSPHSRQSYSRRSRSSSRGNKRYSMSPLRRTPDPFYDYANKKRRRVDVRSKTSVLIVYGINKKFDTKKIYNIFSCYGNVLKIKYMKDSFQTFLFLDEESRRVRTFLYLYIKTKANACLVQMSTVQEANQAIQFVHNLAVFRTRLEVEPSVNTEGIRDVGRWEMFQLENGSDSFASYDIEEKFETTEMSKDMAFPCDRVHFYDVPIEYSAKDIIETMLRKNGHPVPNNIVFDTSNQDQSRSGIMFFSHGPQTGEAIMLHNHMRFTGTPHSMKMHFTRRRK